MHGLRVLCAALLFVAFTLGVPLHAATAHGVTQAAGPVVHAAHVHHHRGDAKCCPGHHVKAGPGALCDMACNAAVAVLDAPSPRLGTSLTYPVRFAAGPLIAAHGAAPAPDPFPPRPPRVA